MSAAQATSHEPPRARALLSSTDFRLLRTALASHAKTVESREEIARINALYHRLGAYD